MIKPAVLDAMVASGCTAEQIAAAVKADQSAASGAARQARYRARKAGNSDDSDVTSVTQRNADVTDLSPKETSPTPPKEITPIPVSEPRGSSTESAREFASFWSLYPNKVGKPAAQASFVKARKRAEFETIMAGLRRYVAKADDRAWCNPQTWLNQDRWDDQPADTPTPRATAPPGGKITPMDAYKEIARERGWTDEPELLPGTDQDANRLQGEGGGHQGTVVDLRRGPDWRVG